MVKIASARWALALALALTSPLLAQAFECSTSAFQTILPPNATIVSTTTVPENATFHVPSSDIAYPTSPTQLRALCAIEVNVTSSPISAYTFGLFLPEEWNERFLAVGNGGFSGGINWLDMVGFDQSNFLERRCCGFSLCMG